MSIDSEKPGSHADLRQKAEISLSGGHAPATQGWTIGAASLTLLHRLAGDPATASDALKLLHELQVHQVELDLQHEHLLEEYQTLEQSMSRLIELYVFAPVAYFLVSVDGQIVEGNAVGAGMLGVQRDNLYGMNIASLVAPGGGALLLELLVKVQGRSADGTCKVKATDGQVRDVQIRQMQFRDVHDNDFQVIASASPGGQHCLVVITPVSSVDVPAAVLPA